MRRSARAAALAGWIPLLAALITVLPGCGRKGPPLPPEIRIADTTRDLSVVQDGDRARLRWAYPQMTTAGGPLPDLERVEVWRTEMPLAQEPPSGTTAKDRQMRRNFMSGRGEIIARLEGEGLDLATRGNMLEYVDDLDRWLTGDAAEDVTVLWYAVRSVCCRGRISEFSNIVRLVPKRLADPPGDLRVTAQPEGPHLEWTPVEDLKVQVERSEDGRKWQVVSPEPLAEGEWVDTTAEQGRSWWYRLRGVTVDRAGTVTRKGAPGSPVRVDFPDVYPPAEPGDLVCLPEAGRVRLRWRAAEGATAYSIQRRSGSKDPEVLVEAYPEVSFIDETPLPGNVTYIIRAVDDAGNFSDPVRCKTIVEAP